MTSTIHTRHSDAAPVDSAAPVDGAAALLRAVPAPAYRWPRACVALYVAGARELLRAPMMLVMTAAVPLLFIVLYGIVLRGPSGPTVRLGVAAAPRGAVAAAVERQLRAVPGVTLRAGSTSNLLGSLHKDDLDGIVTLPASLDTALHGRRAALTVTYDPARQSMAAILQSLVTQVADRVDRALTRRGQVLFVDAVPLNGRVLDQFSYALPGIVAFALIQVGLFATTIPLIQLRQNGVLRQLGATPLRRWVLAVSQIALRVTLALLQVALLLALSHFALGVPLVGSPLALLLVTVLGALTMIALGYLLASRARTGESGNGLVTIVFMPLLFLSGLFIPLDIAPSWMKTVSAVIPSTYLGDALRQVMIEATPRFNLAVDLAAMAAFLVGLSAAAIRLFRWE